jgi:hypothetical protein
MKRPTIPTNTPAHTNATELSTTDATISCGHRETTKSIGCKNGLSHLQKYGSYNIAKDLCRHW